MYICRYSYVHIYIYICMYVCSFPLPCRRVEATELAGCLIFMCCNVLLRVAVCGCVATWCCVLQRVAVVKTQRMPYLCVLEGNVQGGEDS